ncbi:MAG: rod shape-determining protein [Candidatus Eremiobacterota bacterium]
MLVGLDLGSSVVRLVESGRGGVLRHPAVVAQDHHFPDVLAVGETALRMQGRMPDHLTACRPVTRSRLGSPHAARLLLQPFMGKLSRRWSRPSVVVALPLSSSHTERAATVDLLKAAGARTVEAVETPLAAGVGSVPAGKDPPPMVLSLGASTTEAAVLCKGLVVSDWIGFGGQSLDQALMRHLRLQHGLEVSSEAAEELKRSIGSADPAHDGLSLRVHGRELSTRLPHSAVLTGEEVRQVLAEPLAPILRLLRTTLDRTPPAMAGEVLQHGVTLTGGAAQLHGLDRWLARETGMPVQVAEDPENAVVRGTLGKWG